MSALDAGLIISTTPTRRVGPDAEWWDLAAACPQRVDIARFSDATPSYAHGRCQCRRPEPPAPTCICGDRGTHRPEPGIGCTRPGCLCLEPGEPVAPPPRPARVWLAQF